jgi:hypothetical protein
LDVASDRRSEAGDGIGGPGERSDAEPDRVPVAFDDERFFAAFGVTLDGSIREPEAVGIVHDRNDAARRERMQRDQGERERNRASDLQ